MLCRLRSGCESIVVMVGGGNRDAQSRVTGSIATGKCRRGSNYYANTIHIQGEQPQFDVEDDFLNTQGQIQVPPPIQSSISIPDPIPRKSRNVQKRTAMSKFHDDYLAFKREEMKLICTALEKKSERIATRNEKFSVSAAMEAFQQLQGFSIADFVYASTMFIDNAGVCEAFLSYYEEHRAAWIKGMIDLHKAKQ
ncbi:uncharacterized protein LOC144567625 isoform X2 [Carex rostrata]